MFIASIQSLLVSLYIYHTLRNMEMHFASSIFGFGRSLGLVQFVGLVEFLTVVVATGCYWIPRLLMISKLIHRMLRLIRKIIGRKFRFEVNIVLRLPIKH